MISLILWASILWICFGVGAAALHRLRVRPRSPAEEIAFAVPLGMGVLAYLLLTVGLLGQLKLWIGIALLALLALLSRRHMLRFIRQAAAARRGLRWRWWALPLLVFFLSAAGFTLIGALAPASDNDYDGLVYHLAIPKLYLQHGRIHSVPWLSHSNFPFTLEMLYLLGLMLRDDSLAKLFHFGCGWLAALAIFAFARHWWGARAGWLGAAIFAAIPLLSWEMMSAYNELAFALYAFLSLYALLRWSEESRMGRRDGWLWVGACSCGLALGVKMLAAAVLLFALAALLWALVRERTGTRGVLRLLAFAAVALAVASPWYLKSYLWTGNPFYPFYHGLFDGRWWSAERAALYTQAQREFGLGGGLAAFLLLPWNLTFHPQGFFDQPQVLRLFNIFILVFGPLLLALLPTLPVTGAAGAPGRLVLSFALIYTLLWFGLSQNGRYLTPILPGLCACAGLAAARLLARRGLAAAAAALALVLGLSSGLYAASVLALPAARVALGLEIRKAYLSRVSEIYPAFAAINRATPPDARIMLLGDEPRGFYLDRDYLLGDHAEIFSPRELADPAALLAALARLRVTHLVLHRSALDDLVLGNGAMARSLAALADQGRIGLRGVYGSLSLWRIRDADSESRRRPQRA